MDNAIIFFADRIQINSQNDLNNYNHSNNHQHPNAQTPTVLSGSAEYHRRSMILRDTALESVREAVADRIESTSSDIIQALNLKRKTISADKLESSPIYTRFHGISIKSQTLLSLLANRSYLLYVQSTSNSTSSTTTTTAYPIEAIAQKDTGTNTNTSSFQSVNIPHHMDHIAPSGDPYASMWKLCRNAYVRCRTNLLHNSVRNHLDFLCQKHGLVGMTRLAGVFLARLCTVETSLYMEFFGHNSSNHNHSHKRNNIGKNNKTNKKDDNDDDDNDDDDDGDKDDEKQNKPHPSTIKQSSKSTSTSTPSFKSNNKTMAYNDAEFQSFLDTLCSNLHRTIRRGVVNVLDLDTLCRIVGVLREERVIAGATPITSAAARADSNVIADVQERLIFRANTELDQEVVRFRPSEQDVNYPDRLRQTQQEQSQQQQSNTTDKKDEDTTENLVLKAYGSWYPPMRAILRVLSKMFRIVDPGVFEDIALHSVQSCTTSLQKAASTIALKSGKLHADLFLVRNLLILREQLSPFDIQLRSLERQLDFSDAGKAVSRFLANHNRRLFSMSTENALVALLREGVSVKDSPVDSTKLEDALRSSCNDFIEGAAISLAGPILAFVDQCKSVTSSGSSSTATSRTGSQTESNSSVVLAKEVTAQFSRAVDRLEPGIGEILTNMKLYMENAATRGILFKPIMRKIFRALEDSKNFINGFAANIKDKKDIESGWNNEDTVTTIFNHIQEIETKLKEAFLMLSK
mmetsp:Transcript_10634/g.15004  ORF Transcript_10634/g.15004 Transcript_10634/m.15004 type:complete len:746 (+) Transcript_10634:2-2239(+)